MTFVVENHVGIVTLGGFLTNDLVQHHELVTPVSFLTLILDYNRSKIIGVLLTTQLVNRYNMTNSPTFRQSQIEQTK